MKNKILSFLFLATILSENAQTTDAISSHDKLSFKQLLIPATLISGGFLLKGSETNQKFQQNIRSVFGTDFQTKMDDYIQFAPVAQIYLGKTLGFTPQRDFQHQT
jgi:hypothetical protein